MVNNVSRLETWRSFIRTQSVVIRALEREMQDEQGLPLTWFEVLAKLEKSPDGKLRMQTLADSLVFSRSGLTRLLDRMAEAGLIDRYPCERDRRGWYAAITPKGKETADRARPGFHKGVDRHFLRHLDSADLEALERAFLKVLAVETPAPPGNGR